MIEVAFGALLVVGGVFGLGFWAGRTSERRWWKLIEQCRLPQRPTTSGDSARYGETL